MSTLTSLGIAFEIVFGTIMFATGLTYLIYTSNVIINKYNLNKMKLGVYFLYSVLFILIFLTCKFGYKK